MRQHRVHQPGNKSSKSQVTNDCVCACVCVCMCVCHSRHSLIHSLPPPSLTQTTSSHGSAPSCWRPSPKTQRRSQSLASLHKSKRRQEKQRERAHEMTVPFFLSFFLSFNQSPPSPFEKNSSTTKTHLEQQYNKRGAYIRQRCLAAWRASAAWPGSSLHTAS